MKSWWNWLAKDVKRHPKAVTKPPKTAVKRVDFRLQIPMVMGDISNERHDDVAPSHPVTQINISYNLNLGWNYNVAYHYVLMVSYKYMDMIVIHQHTLWHCIEVKFEDCKRNTDSATLEYSYYLYFAMLSDI